jgi:hypothetical protein
MQAKVEHVQSNLGRVNHVGVLVTALDDQGAPLIRAKVQLTVTVSDFLGRGEHKWLNSMTESDGTVRVEIPLRRQGSTVSGIATITHPVDGGSVDASLDVRKFD